MKKTWFYILLLLALLAFGLYTTIERKVKSDDARFSEFATPNIEEVTRVDLEDKEGRKMVLAKENGKWMLNGKYPAKMQFVKEMLFTMENIYTASPIADVALEHAIKQMSTRSNKVSVYLNGDDEPEKVYYVGGMSPDKSGTNILREIDGKVSDRIYVVRLPGHNGFVTDVFYVDETLWRETTVFGYAPSEIKQVEVDYVSEDSLHSFTLSNENNVFTLTTPSLEFTDNELDKGVVTNYLMGFTKKNVESYHNEFDKIDSIKKVMPYANLRITDVGNEVLEIPIYYMPNDERSKTQFDEFGRKLKYDVDRYYAEVNENNDWAIIQKYTWNEILLHSHKFLKK